MNNQNLLEQLEQLEQHSHESYYEIRKMIRDIIKLPPIKDIREGCDTIVINLHPSISGGDDYENTYDRDSYNDIELKDSKIVKDYIEQTGLDLVKCIFETENDEDDENNGDHNILYISTYSENEYLKFKAKISFEFVDGIFKIYIQKLSVDQTILNLKNKMNIKIQEFILEYYGENGENGENDENGENGENDENGENIRSPKRHILRKIFWNVEEQFNLSKIPLPNNFRFRYNLIRTESDEDLDSTLEYILELHQQIVNQNPKPKFSKDVLDGLVGEIEHGADTWVGSEETMIQSQKVNDMNLIGPDEEQWAEDKWLNVSFRLENIRFVPEH